MELPCNNCFNWNRLYFFSNMKDLNKMNNKIKKGRTVQKNKIKKEKLINPLMGFNTGLLSYGVDIQKTKKLLKWLKKKKE